MPFSATRDLWLVLKARDEGATAMRAFSRDIRMVGASVQEAQLRAARSAIQNEMATRRLASAYQISQLRQQGTTAATQRAIQAIEGDTKASLMLSQQRINGIDKEIAALRLQRAAMEENRVSTQRMSSSLSGLSQSMAAIGTITVAASAIGVVGLHRLVDAAVQYEQSSALTRTQVDKFATSLQDVEKIGLAVADKIGVPFETIQPALYNIFSSMEVGAADAAKLLEVFSKAAVAGQTDIQKASTATIGILNAFQLPLSTVNHLEDVQFQLVKEGIGTYDEWSQRIGLVTPSAVRFGQSVDMMAAALATSTRMGISAARSATSVSRAMDAMSNPIAVANLKALGINAYNSAGKFRPMIDILTEFRTKLLTLPPQDRIKAILNVFKGAGGTIEARRFLQNMLLTPGNIELFKSIFADMQTSTGSFEKAYSIMADTTATKSELMTNKWQEVKIKAGEILIPTFLKIVSFASRMFDAFNKLSPSTQGLIVKAIALSVVLMGVFGVFALLASIILAIGAAVVTVGASVATFIGVMAALAAIGAVVGAAFIVLVTKSAALRKSISDTAAKFRDFWQGYVKPTAQAIHDAFEKYVMPPVHKLIDLIKTRLMPVLSKLHDYMVDNVISGAKKVGDVFKTTIIFSYKVLGWVIQHILIPAVDRLTQFLHDHQEGVKQVVSALGTFAKYIFIVIAAVAGLALIIGAVLIVAIVAIGAVIAAVIVIIMKIVSAIEFLVKWIGQNVPKAWNYVRDQTVAIWNSIASFFSSIWNTVVDTIKRSFSNAVNAVKNFFSTVHDAFSNAGHFLFDAGKSLIQGLIDGIDSKVKDLMDKMSKVAKVIKDHLPFSPAKTGPLAGRGNPYYSGQAIVRLLSSGMLSQPSVTAMTRASSTVSSMMFGLNGGMPATNYVAAGVGGNGNTYKQDITVNTQEINPRRHSAELGFYLFGRGM